MIGAPGSGKGTVTSRLLKQVTQLTSISTGDLLRKEINAKSEIGLKAQGYVEKGALLPDKFMANLVTDALKKHNLLDSKASFLLDGFPRTRNQAIELTTSLEPLGANMNLAVELDVPHSVIAGRIADRWIHPASGRTYNLSYNPPKVAGKDDVTGEPLAKRPDDNYDTVMARLDKYDETVGPLKEYYKSQGILKTITGKTSDEITPKLIDLVVSSFT